MKTAHIVGLLVILAFLGLGATAFKKTLTPYVSFAEARAAGKSVQVAGRRTNAPTRYDEKNHTFEFTIEDDRGDSMKVVFHGVKPGAFDQAKQIVAIGEYRDGAFHANKLLIKCPSKYQGQQNVDMQKEYTSSTAR